VRLRGVTERHPASTAGRAAARGFSRTINIATSVANVSVDEDTHVSLGAMTVAPGRRSTAAVQHVSNITRVQQCVKDTNVQH